MTYHNIPIASYRKEFLMVESALIRYTFTHRVGVNL